MKFQNKNFNYGVEEMSGIQRGTIKDPTEWEKTQMNMFGHNKIQELSEKVQEIQKSKAPVVPVIPYADQMTFWNYLNDIQYGVFAPAALTKANTWVITRDGSWLVQKNRTGYYAVKKNDKGIATLPASTPLPTAFFDLAYGKIPNELLLKVISFFRDIMKRYNDAEAFIQIYWDKTENKYVINVPKQRISKGSVNYDATENLDASDSERYVFVYECHSHNSMGAFWSGTDNRDEKELRIYGVFGELNKDQYANKHRFFVGEEQIDVDLSLVFDIPKEEENKYIVTHNSKQYMINGDKLILDDKPKYIFETDKGEKVHVPLTSVSLVKAKVEFPETWFKSINVPFQTETKYESRNSLGLPRNGGGLTMPNFPSKGKEKDPFHFRQEAPGYESQEMEKTDEEEIDADYELMAYELGQYATDVLSMTTDFEDPESTFVFLEAIESNLALKNLEKAIQQYYYQSRQFEEGPSDGRY
jgi:PRTRC genetic system protein A